MNVMKKASIFIGFFYFYIRLAAYRLFFRIDAVGRAVKMVDKRGIDEVISYVSHGTPFRTIHHRTPTNE